MKHDWIDILRTKMQIHEMEPLPIDWTKVDNLAEKKAAGSRQSSWGWRRLSAVAALLLLVGWGTVRYSASWSGQDGADKMVPEEKRLAAVSENHSGGKPSSERNRAFDGNGRFEGKEAMATKTSAAKQKPSEMMNPSGVPERLDGSGASDLSESAELVESSESKESAGTNTDKSREPFRSVVRQNRQKTTPDPLLLAEAKMNRSRGKASLLLAASPNMGGSSATMGGLSVAGLYGDAPVTLSFAAPLLLAGKETVPQSTVNHHQPLRFTLACSCPLGNRLSLVSGISYSYLYSELGSQSSGYSSSGSQELHFLGIPLSLRFRFFSIGNFGMYLGAGGMVEKMVGGNLASTIHRGGRKERESSSVSVGSLYWSAHASLGVDYRLFGSISLFGEAGVSHYFNPSIRVSTYYSDHPTSLQLQFGLRYDLP